MTLMDDVYLKNNSTYACHYRNREEVKLKRIGNS